MDLEKLLKALSEEEEERCNRASGNVFRQGAYACMRIPNNVPKGFNPADYEG